MDFTPIFQSILSSLWYLLPLGLLSIIIGSKWFKGKTGEAIVNISAGIHLDSDIYHLIKNVTLPTSDGTTQIDHIIVSVYGIFVIETKNMKGWIFGSDKQKRGRKKIYKKTTKFQNPLHQNYKHTKTIETFLGLTSDQVHSVVVFAGDSEFKTDMHRKCVQR